EAFDIAKVLRCKFYFSCSDVLFETLEFRGPWDRNNPWLLCKQPCKRDLSRCCLFPLRDVAEQINQSLIGFSSFWRKALKQVAKVGTIERRAFVHLSCEKTSTERAIWNKANPQFFEHWQ